MPWTTNGTLAENSSKGSAATTYKGIQCSWLIASQSGERNAYDHTREPLGVARRNIGTIDRFELVDSMECYRTRSIGKGKGVGYKKLWVGVHVHNLHNRLALPRSEPVLLFQWVNTTHNAGGEGNFCSLATRYWVHWKVLNMR